MKLVLLRGLGREAQHWGPFTAIIREKLHQRLNLDAKTLSVHTPDVPGCGLFNREPAGSDIAIMCEHIRQQLDLAPITSKPQSRSNNHEKIVLVGLSMGGMIALDWQNRHPQEIHAVIIINSSCNAIPWYQRLRLRALLTLMLSLTSTVKQREKTVLQLVSNNSATIKQHIESWQEIQRQRPVRRRTLISQLIAASKFTLPNPGHTPGLIISSPKDRLVSNKCSTYIAKQNHWPQHLHPWAGHDLAIDDPEWLANDIGEWLKPQFI